MAAQTRARQRLDLDVYASRFQAISEEMAYVIQRTGFTVYVKESLDFGASLVTTDGETVSFSQRLGVPVLQRSMRSALDACAPYDEGDVVIANDPASSGGLATHLPDVHVLKPVFWRDELLCFLCCFIHATDVGGRVAGSVSPRNSEIYQEGLRLPPIKLYRRGALNEDALKIYLLNCRIPEQNWGDLKALLAAMNTAQERLHRMVDRFGVDAVRGATREVLAYAEESARRAIDAIPAGTYRFVDLLDDDMTTSQPIRIELALRVGDGAITLDFTGSDYEVRSAFNVPVYGQIHTFLALPFAMYMRTTQPSCPLNGGMLRPLTVVAEPGSILHPSPTAAVGVRMATVFRVQDAFFGALARATRDVIPAASSGVTFVPLVAVPDLRSGRMKVSQVQPMIGGSGGRPGRDGIEGRGLNAGSLLMNVPTERLEVDMPIVVRSYSLVTDSAAPGEFRGGAAVRLEFESTSPGAVLTARGMDRVRFRPWGLAGGQSGSRGGTVLRRSGRAPEEIGKIDIVELEPGDVVAFTSPSGGGFGDPLRRRVEMVQRDVRRGLVSPAAAADQYGVIVKNGDVDAEATAARRGELARASSPLEIDFGPERDAYEMAWPEAARLELRRILAGRTPGLRPYLRQLMCQRLDQQLSVRGRVSPEDVRSTWNAICELSEMRSATSQGGANA